MKALLLLSCLVATLALSHVSHPPLPANWKVLRAADASLKLRRPLQVSLTKRNLDVLTRRALEVSDPQHVDYGKHLTHAEAALLTAPHASSVSTVQGWLKTHNITARLVASDVLELTDATVGQLSSAFQTSFGHVSGQVDGVRRTKVRATDALHIPAHVAPHVAAVYGAFGLPRPLQGPIRSTKGRARNGKAAQAGNPIPVTPDVIHQRYNVTGVTATGSPSNQNAVAEFQGEWMQQSDLSAFFKQFVPKSTQCDTPFAFKGDKQSGDGIEALLDIEYIMGVAPCADTEFWGYENDDFCAGVKTWSTAIQTQSNARVHSISYGWQGPLSTIGCTGDEVTDIDASFALLASQGFSIIIASGDTGSACGEATGNTCSPSWPASSLWVTAVGATLDDGSGTGGEMASTQFGSGGGFANFQLAVLPQPSWQAKAVANFLATASSKSLPNPSWYNTSGRATPDVAAYGENFQCIVDGGVEGIGGTSASTPTFAALVTLLNEIRIVQKKKAPLGFLNPFLYQLAVSTPNAFYDVTEGTNGIDRNGNTIPGFPAIAGWDPATGLGTPNFGVIAAAVQALP